MIVCDRCGEPASVRVEAVPLIGGDGGARKELLVPEKISMGPLGTRDRVYDLCGLCKTRLERMVQEFFTTKEPRMVR